MAKQGTNRRGNGRGKSAPQQNQFQNPNQQQPGTLPQQNWGAPQGNQNGDQNGNDQGYDNTNHGAIFRNDRKRSQNSPDYSGTLNVNGVEFWINMWTKTARSGQPYFSVSINEKQDDQNFQNSSGGFDQQQPPPGWNGNPNGNNGDYRFSS